MLCDDTAIAVGVAGLTTVCWRREMAHNLFLIGMLGAVGWIVVTGPPPVKPAEHVPVARVAVRDTSPLPYVGASPRPVIEKRRDPVPLVRNNPVSPVSPQSPASPGASGRSDPAAGDERQTPDDLDRKAAKLAAEADGYRRVSVVGKASNGAWRAKGYRGTTEVLLTVDGTGRVSLD